MRTLAVLPPGDGRRDGAGRPVRVARALVDPEGVHELYRGGLLQTWDAVFRSRWSELPAEVQAVLLRTRDGLPPVFDRLPHGLRKTIFQAGLVTPDGIWVEDRPFFDWVQFNASNLRGED